MASLHPSEIMDFSAELGDLTGLDVLRDKPDSRVALLGKKGIETNVMKLYGIEK